MSFSITILGSSSAVPTSQRYPSAHLLNVDEHFYLIDCGEATQIQLRKYNCKLGKINNIFISHLHGDHIFGLFGLLSSYILLDRKTPLNIFAHHQIKDVINLFLTQFGKGISFKINVIPLRIRNREVIYEDEKLIVKTFPLKHSIPVNGFLFQEKQKPLNIKKDKIEQYQLSLADIHQIKSGNDYILADGTLVYNRELTMPPYKQRSYAFCTDTYFYERIVEDISGADILYHEATFNKKDIARAKKTYHSTSLHAADIAKRANVEKLIIGHFSARYKEVEIQKLLMEAKEVFPNAYIANEGENHEIDLKRIKRL